MKLLIVEDDEEVSSFVQYVLEDENHVVRTASAVAEARDRLLDFSPDLIILDRGLPDQDGLDFCRELRGRPAYAKTPVLFLSSAKTPNDIAEGFSAGGDDYMSKPFDFIELLSHVRALLRRGGGAPGRPSSPS